MTTEWTAEEIELASVDAPPWTRLTVTTSLGGAGGVRFRMTDTCITRRDPTTSGVCMSSREAVRLANAILEAVSKDARKWSPADDESGL